jgi:hypothetical protein
MVAKPKEKSIAMAALNVRNPKRDAPGNWYSVSKYSNR